MLHARLCSLVTQCLWYPRVRLIMITDSLICYTSYIRLFTYPSYAHVSAAVTFKGPAASITHSVFRLPTNPSGLELVIFIATK
jgi:hypothetical protein